MEKKSGTGINVGGSSILIIFVLLCLTTFATLSLVSANADYNMTLKTAAAADNYYSADSLAEEKLAEIDDCLKSSFVGDDAEYFTRCVESLSYVSDIIVKYGGNSITVEYEMLASESQKLSVSINIMPKGHDKGRYNIKIWQLINTAEWVNDDSIDVWNGEM